MTANQQQRMDWCDHSDVPRGTPVWARVFADFCFVLSIGWAVWWLTWIVPDVPDMTSPERRNEYFGGIWLVLIGAFLINVGAVYFVLKSTPTGGPRYYPWRWWLSWLRRRKRSFATEWDEVGPYLGTNHAAYLRSHQWRERRQLKVRQANRRCQSCGASKHLQVHHLSVEYLFDERSADLIVLCHVCHARVHAIARRKALKARRAANTEARSSSTPRNIVALGDAN